MTSAIGKGDAAAATLAIEKNSTAQAKRADRLRTWIQPIVVVIFVAGVLIWAFTTKLDAIEQRNINASTILELTWQHVLISVAVTAIVLIVAVPIGVLVTRRWARAAAPVFLTIANIGQAAPAIGVLVLFFIATEEIGFWIAVLPIAFYSLLPVLRNTMLGIQSVDASYIEAGRGIGMSSSKVLFSIELPLAVPFILAGLRTSLVLAVGTATLATFVGAGGLGELIVTGYKLARYPVLVVGAVLAMGLALLVDWLGSLAEQLIGPKGLR